MKQLAILTFIVASIAFISCEKVVDDPKANPYGAGNVNAPADSVDPYSIQGLHKNIFAVKCANPTCHDGSFEPDFRTVQSSYSSLVYQPVIKNDQQGSYTFRVVPGKVNESWLYERCVTGDPILGRMPLYAPALSNQELLWLSGWIGDGARDLNGEVAQFPNIPPIVRYYWATNSNNVRIDTNRVSGWSSPFIVPQGSSFFINVRVDDDSTDAQNLLINQLKLSTNQDDFSNATVYSATYLSNNIWAININASALTTGTQYYFRYYVQDPEHTTPTEHPRDNLPYYYKQNASFIIQ